MSINPPRTDRIIVTLCGSTRFKEAFEKMNMLESIAGKIVLSVAMFHADGWTADTKSELDSLHFDKIEMSHEVLILNVGGYIGESTLRELAYAIFLGKHVRWLDRDAGERYMSEHSHRIGQLVASFFK